jgi:DNA repair protein RadD
VVEEASREIGLEAKMTKILELRDYQTESIEGLRQGLLAGHLRQMVCAPTGSGKSVCAVSVIQNASRKFSRTAIFVDRVSLTDQFSHTLSEYGIDHGVIQADHWRYRPYEPVQVISTGTLARRDLSKMLPFQLAITDEAHIIIKSVLKFYDENPLMKVVALSATPFSAGLSKIYTNVINVRTTNQLIAEGWLAPMKVYAARAIDMRGAKVKFDGEWEPTEIEKRSMDIIGDIVSGWVEKTNQHFGGKVKTIVFTATVAMGDELCRKFQAAGFNFQQVSYLDGNDDKRRAKIAEFRKADTEIDGLVSCEALGRGFDVPDIRCIISAKPYRKSLSAVIQQLGRGMRPYPGKDYVLVLDHASNVIRFQEDMEAFFESGIHDLDDSELDSKVRKEPSENGRTSECKSCGYVMSAKDEVCPSCGTERPKRKNTIEHKPGELVEIGKSKGKQAPLWMADKAQVQREIWGYALDRKKGNHEAASRFANAQYRNIYGEWPHRAFRNIEPCDPSYDVSRKIKANLVRFFKSKARAAA